MAKEQDQILDEAEKVEVDTVAEDAAPSTDVSSLFEGEDLSEEFKGKVSTIFEAAVADQVASKTAELKEEMEAEYATKLEESVAEVKENLNDYLDYVVNEWAEENKVALEAGVKVEMAENFMEGLKNLFYENNVQIDEETIDVVADLEGTIEEQAARNNGLVNESIELKKEIADLKASIAFGEMSEGLTDTQVDRMKTLAETVDTSDLEVYKAKLGTIKETFFKKEAPVVTESVVEDSAVVLEEGAKEVVTEHQSVNAYLSFLSASNG